MKLGIVTYMWGAEWDLPTLIKNCALTGFEGVELRTTHKHGVEISLSKTERAEVRKRFADSPVKFVGPGTACEYQNADHGIVQQQIELTKKFVELSADIGGTGVKVRPNGFAKGVEQNKTIEQIGLSLRECAKFGEGFGQEIRVEVHGNGTADPAVMQKIMQVANHPKVVVCWNSNPGETVNGSLAHSFGLLKNKLGGTVHIHDLFDKQYPYRELFKLLRDQDYKGYCLSESPPTTDPIRVMHYYRVLFDEWTKG
ncbi:MAG: sugar phosphate isomerase/epimerase [Planctomycetales bacterium]|nr:sugar phosphate isomerase/epimerase [Planctomycetales bacterium]